MARISHMQKYFLEDVLAGGVDDRAEVFTNLLPAFEGKPLQKSCKSFQRLLFNYSTFTGCMTQHYILQVYE